MVDEGSSPMMTTGARLPAQALYSISAASVGST